MKRIIDGTTYITDTAVLIDDTLYYRDEKGIVQMGSAWRDDCKHVRVKRGEMNKCEDCDYFKEFRMGEYCNNHQPREFEDME